MNTPSRVVPLIIMAWLVNVTGLDARQGGVSRDATPPAVSGWSRVIGLEAGEKIVITIGDAPPITRTFMDADLSAMRFSNARIASAVEQIPRDSVRKISVYRRQAGRAAGGKLLMALGACYAASGVLLDLSGPRAAKARWTLIGGGSGLFTGGWFLFRKTEVVIYRHIP